MLLISITLHNVLLVNSFNATNALVVAQANASWSQSITTAETAAMNQSNRDAAMTANQFTVAAYNNVLQEERDMISYAYKIAESEAERALRIQLQAMQNEVSMAEIQANIDVGRGKGLGSFLGAVAPGLINWASNGAIRWIVKGNINNVKFNELR